MRNIKFRVWDILNKNMLSYGKIMHLPMWEVFPGTPEQRAFNVMQYTTMKDNNQKEIYEGDIVEFLDGEQVHCMSYEHDGFWNRGVVVWSSERLGFDVTNRIGIDEDDVWHDIRVIGNIYENKELMEE